MGSRYYNPEVGRFINADDRIADIGDNLIGYNMFAYCFNNPINMYDPTGSWPEWATLALGIGLATVAVAATVLTLGAAAPAAACTIATIAVSYGASAGAAIVIGETVAAATVIVAATYAGDAAYQFVTGTSPIKEIVFKGDDELFQLSRLYVGAGIDTYLNLASMNGAFCFVEGTLVLSSEGHVPIEDIAVGDLVWAEETTTREKDIKKVVNTFVNETSELVHVYVNGEEIVSTPNHPFYSPVRGWIEAIKLRAGDMLVLQNGAYVVVEFIQHEILEAPIKVYNFEVEDYHTYYVGENSVLVHNECGAAKKAKLPTSGKIRYIPPAGSGNNLPRTSAGGYIDKFNNVWVKGPSRTSGEPFEWDVQLSRTGYGMLNWLSRDGKHINVSLKGNITH